MGNPLYYLWFWTLLIIWMNITVLMLLIKDRNKEDILYLILAIIFDIMLIYVWIIFLRYMDFL